MSSRRDFLLVSAGAAVAAVTGCTPSQSAPPTGASSPSETPTPGPPTSASPRPSATSKPPTEPAKPTTESTSVQPRVAGVLAQNMTVPWGIAFLSSGAALVSERNTGRIVRVDAGGKKTTLGEISGIERPSGIGEGGLMGIALAPGDEETLYAYYTSSSDDRLARVSLAGGRVGRPRALLTGIASETVHHGGRLLFAPDGSLFLSTGDAQNPDSAQDRDALTGKILRLTADGRAAPGNPFGNRTWSYGHRNIQGLAFDAQDRLWATEYGAKDVDELNLIVRGGNYGWPEVEGRSDNSDYKQPKFTWSPTSLCSPAGLAITRSTAFVAALQGRCVFGLRLRGDTVAGDASEFFARDYGRIRNVVVAPDGALWVTTSNTDGRTDPGADDDQILRVTL